MLPPHSYFFNCKGYFSIILQAIFYDKYEFIYLDIGRNGRNSDGDVFDRTEFRRCLASGELHLPLKEENVDGLMFVFVADEAFPLLNNILNPFPMRNLTQTQKIYNCRVSRARRVVENAFGIMSNRFRIFHHTAINLSLHKIDSDSGMLLCAAQLPASANQQLYASIFH